MCIRDRLVGGAQVRIGFIDRGVATGLGAFGAHQLAGQGGGVAGVVHRALRRAGLTLRARRRHLRARRLRRHFTQAALLLVDDEGLDRRHADSRVGVLRQAVQDVGRNHADQGRGRGRAWHCRSPSEGHCGRGARAVPGGRLYGSRWALRGGVTVCGVMLGTISARRRLDARGLIRYLQRVPPLPLSFRDTACPPTTASAISR